MASKNTLEEQCKKYLGLPPYNTPANICYKDSYCYNAMVMQFGAEAVKRQIALLRKGNS